jgi:AcrR family transcriptional regulator
VPEPDWAAHFADTVTAAARHSSFDGRRTITDEASRKLARRTASEFGATHGYEESTVEQIAEAAEISPRHALPLLPGEDRNRALRRS